MKGGERRGEGRETLRAGEGEEEAGMGGGGGGMDSRGGIEHVLQEDAGRRDG